MTLLYAPLPVMAEDGVPTVVPGSEGDIVEMPAASSQQVPPPGMAGVNILPAKSLSTEQFSDIDPNEPTHAELRLTPDKSEIIRLDAEAGTVIVGNPNHISVMADNTKTLVVVPKMPGATYFTVLDSKGNVLMQRHVIVASPKEKYVRIRKSCATAESENCQTTAVYYCPDMCHEIISNGESKDKSSGSAALDKALGSQGTSGVDATTEGTSEEPETNDEAGQ